MLFYKYDTRNKNQIINYLNANKTGSVINPEALAFTKLASQSICNGGEVDFNFELIKDSTFVNSKTECIHEKLKQNETNLYSQMLSGFSEKTNSNLIFRIGCPQNGDWGIAQGSAIANNYEIVISQEVENGSNLMRIVTLCHELIHAYMFNTLEENSLIHFDNMGNPILDFSCNTNTNYNGINLNELSIKDRYVALLCAMNQNNALNQQWTHNLFNTANFSIVNFRQDLENFLFNEHDWENEHVTFKNEAISIFGTNWKREIAKRLSWVGLEATDEYINYINGYVTNYNKLNYLYNIKNKVLTAKNTCE